MCLTSFVKIKLRRKALYSHCIIHTPFQNGKWKWRSTTKAEAINQVQRISDFSTGFLQPYVNSNHSTKNMQFFPAYLLVLCSQAS